INRKIGYLAKVSRQCLSPMLYIGFEPFPGPRTSYLNFTSIALFRGTLMIACNPSSDGSKEALDPSRIG
ncbi:MAG: hypothetical protein IJS61_10725, partial [Firmicutes bacterium]|nr:hypothetical protein [Bacillota bacterium]